MKKITHLASASLAVLALANCAEAPKNDDGLTLNYEKFTLDNGLDVILHVDRSDPVVAIDLAAHVGSARETAGRTGFAHLFEHLLFLDSENLGYGGLDEMNTRIGGEGTNGFTTHDMTQYFQAVPKDALEKVIWAEADKLGYFIKTVSQNVIDKEKQVVKNEKRQRVDNEPYGHNFYIINKALYPQDHPYNWQVIGSLADLDAASLQDVKDFYARWYVPNNVTVTISGDFDVADAKTLVEKYFGDIPRGKAVEKFKPRPAVLTESQNLYHEDAFATVPELTMIWPAVEQYHPDSYALNILAEYLTEGKRAPLNEVLIDEEKLTSDVSAFYYGKEVSGEFYIFVKPNEGEDIDGLIKPLSDGFNRFNETGISQADLDRIKAGLEVEFYGNVQSALGKAIQLGEYNMFTGDPGFYKTDIERIQAVSTEDVMRVFETYIKNKHLLYTSFVPEGQLDLKLDDYYTPTRAKVVEEKIVQGAEEEVDFDPAARIIADPTPSKFDRRVEPEFGDTYTLPAPTVWRDNFANGIKVYGIESNETPLVYFNLSIDAGRNRMDVAKPAVAAMTADLMEKGTANMSTAQLEDAIKSLGSSISISATSEATEISGSTLARNFDATIALVQDMLLTPRWDSEEFETLKRKRMTELTQSEGNPNSISYREALKLRYPEGHPYRYTDYGTQDLLETVALDDLKAFYAANYAPQNAKLQVVGAVDKLAVSKAFSGISSGWDAQAPEPVTVPQSADITESQVYFYDVPGAKQSVLRIERPSLTAIDPDYALARAINFPLGGIYTSKLMSSLRVDKGYTYGIRSGFNGGLDRGLFSIRSSVRTNVTLESLELIKEIVEAYGPDFTQEDLDVMKDALLRGQALKNETLSDKLGMVSNIAQLGYADDYAATQAAAIKALTLEDVKRLTQTYLRPEAMNYVIVGDAKTQAERLEDLGFGEPVMLKAPDE